MFEDPDPIGELGDDDRKPNDLPDKQLHDKWIENDGKQVEAGKVNAILESIDPMPGHLLQDTLP